MVSPRKDRGLLTQQLRSLSVALPCSPMGGTTSALLPLEQKRAAAAMKGGGVGGGGSWVEQVRRSQSGTTIMDEDGAGGKGTGEKLIDTDGDACLDRNDPNYDSGEEPDGYKKSVVPIIEEYLSNGDVKLAASNLKELGYDDFHRYFVKQLVSMAMDRPEEEKVRVSVLLSSLCGNVISSTQIMLGFVLLLEAVDDPAVDIPDAVDGLVHIIGRALVDEILPPAFLAEPEVSLLESSKVMKVVQTVKKSYLSAPHHPKTVLNSLRRALPPIKNPRIRL